MHFITHIQLAHPRRTLQPQAAHLLLQVVFRPSFVNMVEKVVEKVSEQRDLRQQPPINMCTAQRVANLSAWHWLARDAYTC